MKIMFIGDIHLQDNAPRSRTDNYFESIILKLDWAFSQCDYLICTGDVFNVPRATEECKNVLVRLVKKHNKPLYTIWGNHDIHNMNMGTRSKTSLDLLMETGHVIELKEIHFPHLSIYGADLTCTIPKIPKSRKKPEHYNILVGHCFLDIEDDLNMKSSDIEKSEYNYIVLGHEHQPKPEVVAGKTTVYIPGSFVRNTADDFNFLRVPRCLLLDTNKPEALHYVDVPVAKPAEEILVRSAGKTSQTIYMSNLKNLVSQLDIEGSVVPKMQDILKELDTPEEWVKYIKEKYVQAGIVF